jgi:hypothetical protein
MTKLLHIFPVGKFSLEFEEDKKYFLNVLQFLPFLPLIKTFSPNSQGFS